MMTEKWATGRPWMGGDWECPLYRITGETPSRLYAELVSGSGYLHGYSKKYIQRNKAVFLTGPDAIDAYRKAWADREARWAEADEIARGMKLKATADFEEAVAGLVIND